MLALFEKTRQAIEVLSLLAKDDSPTVRRAAAAEISALVSAIASPELFAAALTGVIAQLVADEHDSVRLVALLELGASTRVRVEGNTAREQALFSLANCRPVELFLVDLLTD